MKYKIKNWSEFQQYKDDRPLHWIKLHTKLLADFRFNQLSELSQLHLIKLWLLAASKHGELEGDSEWIGKQINTKKPDLDGLVREGFLVRTESHESVPREEESREEREEENTRVEAGLPPREVCPYQKIINLYHEKLPMCPQVVKLTDTRKRAIGARWKNGMNGLENWELYFNDVGKSRFLTGRVDPSPGRKQFIADIDFLIRESTIVKMQEGKYSG